MSSDTYGLKVSFAGYDVISAADKNLAWSSAFDSFKIFQKNDLFYSTNSSGNGSAQAAHHLGYAPAFIGYQHDTAHNWFTGLDPTGFYPKAFMLGVNNFNGWLENMQFRTVYTDSINIYAQSNNDTPSVGQELFTITFIDLAQTFVGSTILTAEKYGLKASLPNYDVLTAQLYQLQYTSEYPTAKFQLGNVASGTLSLPALGPGDLQQGTYVDINHLLGYGPIFLAYFKSNTQFSGRRQEVPRWGQIGTDVLDYLVSAWCDNTRIRLSFERKTDSFDGNTWPAETITYQIYYFNEGITP